MTAPASSPASKLKVINLFGAPGMGKSAARSGVFWLMKSLHLSVEEVSEYAKYLVLTDRKWQLNDEQLYLFAKQLHKQHVVARNHYEFAVTDSPVQLCSYYAPPAYYKTFEPLVDEVFETFENINFFLSRDLSGSAVFEERGRLQDRRAAMNEDVRMRAFLADKGIECVELPVDMFTPWRIVEHIAPGKMSWPVFPPKAA
jgi:hypothetical protein